MKSAYVLKWRAPTMPASAFWYYESADSAQKDYDYFQRCHGYTADPPEACMVPDNCPLLDKEKP